MMNSFKVFKTDLAKRATFLSILLLTGNLSFAQLQLTCPNNIVTVADPNQCGAVVNYSILYNTNLTEDTTISAGPYGNWYYWQVPNGVGQVEVELWGGQGNSNALGIGLGGLGGHVRGTLPVTPGEWLYFEIGSGGNVGPYGNYTGGGYEAGYSPCFDARGGGGGGSSSVWQGGWSFYDRKMVAGGGGGAGGNRVQGCGRGTGGGGGGGWFGGGGGAAWPFGSTVVPTGGNQFQGGMGGTSTYSGNQPYNNGYNGDIYYGGYGGEELQSAQGGNGTGADGGNAGGLVGSDGFYAGSLSSLNNFTGQSGAGGSSYINPVVINGVIEPSTWTGTGQMKLTYPAVVTETVLQGQPSGGFFPLGTTTVQVQVSQTGDADTCLFTVRVEDNVPPDIYCPLGATVSLDANCSYVMPNYRPSTTFFDNCTAQFNLRLSLQQSPAPGSTGNGLGTDTVWVYVTDDFGLQDSCYLPVEKLDGAAPTASFCPGPVTFQPDTLWCGPNVQFTPPTFVDNCPGSLTVTSNYEPGDNFLMGTTTVNYIATDQSGYNAQCSFTVTVLPPRLDSLVNITYYGPCQGDTVMLVADPGYPTYLWSTFETNDTIYVTEGGTYTLKVRDGFCNATDTFVVELQPAPTPILIWSTSPPQFCTSQSFPTYQWYRSVHPDSSFTLIQGATSQCYQPTQSLYHKVQVTHFGNNCVTESNPEIRTSVEEALSNPGFIAYPNPAGDRLQIEITENFFGDGNIRLINAVGQTVINQDFEHLQTRHELDLSDLPAGSYTVEVKSGEFMGRIKIIHVD